MAPLSAIEHLANPLVSAEQLAKFKGHGGDDSASKQFAQFQLITAAGVLLRLPQAVIANAIVLLQRFLVSSKEEDREGFSPKTFSASSIYLAAKISATPLSPRSVINVYAYLLSKASPLPCVNPAGVISRCATAGLLRVRGDLRERKTAAVYLREYDVSGR